MKYRCSNCEAESLKWEGRCSKCGEWGTLEELAASPKSAAVLSSSGFPGSGTNTSSLADVGAAEFLDLDKLQSQIKSGKAEGIREDRIPTGMEELDRVLGSGIVRGEVILVSGEPGIGKSTLLLQLALNLANTGKVLYVSGEESPAQLKSRIDRLVKNNKSIKFKAENLLISTEIVVERIAALVAEQTPELIIVDSIQTMISLQGRSYAGGVSQVRLSGAVLTRLAKVTGVPVMIVGQINKEGTIAGPKVLEHTVDCVLYLEGDEFNTYRILRSMKNRFGPTNEIGVFEMLENGMVEVANPSQIFLENREAVAGAAISAILKGSRVVFVEIQALVSERGNSDGPVKRVANGIKKSKLEMLCAVMSKRGKARLGDKDVFVNIGGGLNINDPIIDLAICAAIKSSLEDKIYNQNTIYVGEVGLTGGIRGYHGLATVVKEAKRLGYKNIVVPDGDYGSKVGVKIVNSIVGV